MARYKTPDFQVRILAPLQVARLLADGAECICPKTTERPAGTSAYAVQPVRGCPFHGEETSMNMVTYTCKVCGREYPDLPGGSDGICGRHREAFICKYRNNSTNYVFEINFDDVQSMQTYECRHSELTKMAGRQNPDVYPALQDFGAFSVSRHDIEAMLRDADAELAASEGPENVEPLAFTGDVLWHNGEMWISFVTTETSMPYNGWLRRDKELHEGGTFSVQETIGEIFETESD